MAQPFVITPRDEALCAPLALAREAPDGEGGAHASSCTIGRPDGHGRHHTVELETTYCSSHGVLLEWAENGSDGECVCVTNRAHKGFIRYWQQPQQVPHFLGSNKATLLHPGDTLDVGLLSCESVDNAARAPSKLSFTVSRPGVPAGPRGDGDAGVKDAAMAGDDTGEAIAAPAGDTKAGGEAVPEEAAVALCAQDVLVEDSPQAVTPAAPQAAPEMQTAVPEAEEAPQQPEAAAAGAPTGGVHEVSHITSSDDDVEPMSSSESDDASPIDSGRVLETDAAGTVVESVPRAQIQLMEEDGRTMLGRGDSAAGGGRAVTPPVDRRHEEAAPRDAGAAALVEVRPTAAMQPPVGLRASAPPPPKRQRSDAAQQPAQRYEAPKGVEVIDLTGD